MYRKETPKLSGAIHSSPRLPSGFQNFFYVTQRLQPLLLNYRPPEKPLFVALLSAFSQAFLKKCSNIFSLITSVTVFCKYEASVKISKKITQDDHIITRLLSVLKYNDSCISPTILLSIYMVWIDKSRQKAPESFKEETELTVSLLNVTYDGKLMQKIYLQLNYLNAVPLPLCSQCFKNYN